MDTLAGRFRYYWDLTSSTTLLATRADIGRARHLMQCRRAAARAGTDDDARMTKAEFLAAAAYHGGGLGAADYARLDKEGVGSLPMALVRHQLPALEMANAWLNERLVAATTHPETSEYVFPPFRRSAFVAANIPIYLGMLMSPQTTGFIVFWQVFNQSYNVGMNYFNRSATEPTPISQLMPSYGMAVAASCSAGLGAKSLLSRVKPRNPIALAACAALVPFAGSAAAGTLNLLVTRRDEYFNGIAIRDGPSGDAPVIGTSRIAGYCALRDTVASRLLLSGTGMVLPAVTMAVLDKTPLFTKLPRIRPVVYTAAIACALRLALPLSLTPWHWAVPTCLRDLEPELLQRLLEEQEEGEKAQWGAESVVFYNRGM